MQSNHLRVYSLVKVNPLEVTLLITVWSHYLFNNQKGLHPTLKLCLAYSISSIRYQVDSMLQQQMNISVSPFKLSTQYSRPLPDIMDGKCHKKSMIFLTLSFILLHMKFDVSFDLKKWWENSNLLSNIRSGLVTLLGEVK